MTHHIRIQAVPTKEEDRDYRKLARALLLLLEHQQKEVPSKRRIGKRRREPEP